MAVGRRLVAVVVVVVVVVDAVRRVISCLKKTKRSATRPVARARGRIEFEAVVAGPGERRDKQE